ncbi:MAG: hypothetical protein ACOZB3_04045 [Calditrichota bacterium]
MKIQELHKRPSTCFYSILTKSLTVFLLFALFYPEDTDAELSTFETTAISERKWSAGGDFDINSRYLWRGMICNDKSVAQPSAWISVSDLTLSLWANRGIEERNSPAFLDEVDVTLDFLHSLSSFNVLASLSYFHYPQQDDAPATGEIMVGGEYTWGLVSLYSRHMIDYLEYSGAYWGEGGLSTDYQILPDVGIEMSTGLGWASTRFNESYWGLERSALSLWTSETALNWSITDNCYIRPHVELNSLLDSELSAKADKNPANFGLQFGIEY